VAKGNFYICVNIKTLAEAFTKSDVEILLSTMNRQSLDFLEPMFPFAHFSEFNILIINQTKEGSILSSDYPAVRVINSFERGLSRSRNLAVVSAKCKIGLIADDDLVFVEGFDEKIAQGFNRFPTSAAVKFITTTFEGIPFRKYPEVPVAKLGALQRLNSTSWEIALNIDIVRRSGIKFDTNFGLGTDLPLGEEPVLLNDLHKAGYQLSHEPEIIVTHKAYKDSDNIPLDLNYKTRGAYLTRIFWNMFPVWLAIQLAYNLKNGVITLKQVPYCIKHALAGRKKALDAIRSKG
jgi:hypothetical protein